MAKKSWAELSPPARAAVVTGAVIEVVLTTVAVVDLVRRPTDQVRGPKAAWLLGCAIQPVGPVAYLLVGRRSAGRATLEA